MKASVWISFSYLIFPIFRFILISILETVQKTGKSAHRLEAILWINHDKLTRRPKRPKTRLRDHSLSLRIYPDSLPLTYTLSREEKTEDYQPWKQVLAVGFCLRPLSSLVFKLRSYLLVSHFLCYFWLENEREDTIENLKDKGGRGHVRRLVDFRLWRPLARYLQSQPEVYFQPPVTTLKSSKMKELIADRREKLRRLDHEFVPLESWSRCQLPTSHRRLRPAGPPVVVFLPFASLGFFFYLLFPGNRDYEANVRRRKRPREHDLVHIFLFEIIFPSTDVSNLFLACEPSE